MKTLLKTFLSSNDETVSDMITCEGLHNYMCVWKFVELYTARHGAQTYNCSYLGAKAGRLQIWGQLGQLGKNLSQIRIGDAVQW